jgi:hypothetical protein
MKGSSTPEIFCYIAIFLKDNISKKVKNSNEIKDYIDKYVSVIKPNNSFQQSNSSPSGVMPKDQKSHSSNFSYGEGRSKAGPRKPNRFQTPQNLLKINQDIPFDKSRSSHHYSVQGQKIPNETKRIPSVPSKPFKKPHEKKYIYLSKLLSLKLNDESFVSFILDKFDEESELDSSRNYKSDYQSQSSGYALFNEPEIKPHHYKPNSYKSISTNKPLFSSTPDEQKQFFNTQIRPLSKEIPNTQIHSKPKEISNIQIQSEPKEIPKIQIQSEQKVEKSEPNLPTNQKRTNFSAKLNEKSKHSPKLHIKH